MTPTLNGKETPMFTATPEQTEALRLFRTGDSFQIEAGAGAGKTSTLVMLSEATPNRRGQYVVFNRPLRDEAADKFPKNVAVNTAHQLAFKAGGHAHMPRIKASRRMRSSDIAYRLGLTNGITVQVDGADKYLSPSKLAGIALRMVVEFCQSADRDLGVQHMPHVDGLDVPSWVNGAPNLTNHRVVAAHVLPFARRAWDDLRKTSGHLPSGHHVYLKLWQLDNPVIRADFILFDEAQDASPVMVDVVTRQAHAQIVWVGDSQQEIYGFTGAVNALQTIDTPHKTFLTKSFRFGPAIADQANQVLARIPGAEIRIVGHDPVASVVGPVDAPGAILTRTNAEAVRAVLDAQASGRQAFLVGGAKDITRFAEAVDELNTVGTTDHPELAIFGSWDDVKRYVDEDEAGRDLELLVKLVDEFGTATILAALRDIVDEADADVVVSTAHRSKGREWDTVQLGPDFPEDPAKMRVEDHRLLYVAVTRARVALDITRVRCLDGAGAPAGAPVLPQEAPGADAGTGTPDDAVALARALLRLHADTLRLGVDLSDGILDELQLARTLAGEPVAA